VAGGCGTPVGKVGGLGQESGGTLTVCMQSLLGGFDLGVVRMWFCVASLFCSGLGHDEIYLVVCEFGLELYFVQDIGILV
jgi:hypothetical protein